MVIGKRIPRAKSKDRRQFFSYEVEWGGADDHAPRVIFIHFTDLDTNKQRTYLFEFGKPTVTTIYRIVNEIVAILNAELDHGTFVVQPKPAPRSKDWGPTKQKKLEEQKIKRNEARKGSLVGKNDRSRREILNEYSKLSGRIDDIGFDI